MSNNPYMPFKADILSVTKQTAIDWTYKLACSIDPKWGQFVQVSLPGVGECPLSVSDYGDDYIELTIRNVGKVTNIIHQLNEQDHLFIRGPYGNHFPVPDFAGQHLVIAAGGTGLAPVKSIINHFHRQPDLLTQFDLLAGFKSPSDLLFQQELTTWERDFNVQVTVDEVNPGQHWDGRVGLVTSLIPQLNIPDPANTQVVVVGPPVMMKFTVLEFLMHNIPQENIWVSFERKMSCGIGKCGHCKIDDTYVCLEGPVFNYTEAKKLLD